MHVEEEQEPQAIAPPGTPLSDEENTPCIEYLKRAIMRLLMKNESMRFELLAVRQKVVSIERTVFGSGGHELQKRLPAPLLQSLRDLCHGEPAVEKRGERPPAWENVRGRPESAMREEHVRAALATETATPQGRWHNSAAPRRELPAPQPEQHNPSKTIER